MWSTITLWHFITGPAILFWIYLDDYGINNPLGAASDKEKLLGVYYSVFQDPKLASNIHQLSLSPSLKEKMLQNLGFPSVCLSLLKIWRIFKTEINICAFYMYQKDLVSEFHYFKIGNNYTIKGIPNTFPSTCSIVFFTKFMVSRS